MGSLRNVIHAHQRAQTRKIVVLPRGCLWLFRNGILVACGVTVAIMVAVRRDALLLLVIFVGLAVALFVGSFLSASFVHLLVGLQQFSGVQALTATKVTIVRSLCYHGSYSRHRLSEPLVGTHLGFLSASADTVNLVPVLCVVAFHPS